MILFTEYLKNPNSRESIEVFCDGLIIALKKIDKPIIELFSGDLRIEVEKFLEHQLPGIIDKLIEIVKRNSNEIEQLIESSIDQTIYDQQTIKRIILSAIRMFLIENFTQKYDIINKIVEMLKGIDVDDLSKTISVQVVDMLHQKSISSIIGVESILADASMRSHPCFEASAIAICAMRHSKTVSAALRTSAAVAPGFAAMSLTSAIPASRPAISIWFRSNFVLGTFLRAVTYFLSSAAAK
jgi:transcription termination factor NusB